MEALEGDWVGWLTPESELEEIELGERVCEWLINWMLVSAYATEKDRVESGTRALAGSVASATSWRGLPFPEEWWRPSAGSKEEK